MCVKILYTIYYTLDVQHFILMYAKICLPVSWKHLVKTMQPCTCTCIHFIDRAYNIDLFAVYLP